MNLLIEDFHVIAHFITNIDYHHEHSADDCECMNIEQINEKRVDVSQTLFFAVVGFVDTIN